MSDIIEKFRCARVAGVPIIAIETPDPYATILAVSESCGADTPCLSWDIARGVLPMNETGRKAITAMGIGDPAEATNLPEFLNGCLRPNKGSNAKGLPPDSVLFLHSASRFWDEFPALQSCYNTRDPFKEDGRTLVFVTSSAKLPAELASDVVVLSEPLPTDEALKAIITEVYNAARVSTPEIPPLTQELTGKAVAAVAGLSSFSAEQVVAMGIRRAGFNFDDLWAMKKTQIEQTPGLTVDKGKERFADIGGCDNVKNFARMYVKGKREPRAIVRLDEIEKMLAGAGGDSSGTSQDQLGVVLSYMQDNNIPGCLFFGPPGSAKSLVSKAIGNEIGIPTISMDMGAMKGSLVGSSEARIRQALKVVQAVSSGNALFIGTCNKLAGLPPELRRRFKFGLYMFDLPTDEERLLIWGVCLKRHGMKIKPAEHGVSDTGWTGAEIEACCQISVQLGCTLAEASEYIVPVSRSASEEIARLRTEADGKFISANYAGVYSKTKATEFASVETSRRRMKVIQ